VARRKKSNRGWRGWTRMRRVYGCVYEYGRRAMSGRDCPQRLSVVDRDPPNALSERDARANGPDPCAGGVVGSASGRRSLPLRVDRQNWGHRLRRVYECVYEYGRRAVKAGLVPSGLRASRSTSVVERVPLNALGKSHARTKGPAPRGGLVDSASVRTEPAPPGEQQDEGHSFRRGNKGAVDEVRVRLQKRGGSLRTLPVGCEPARGRR